MGLRGQTQDGQVLAFVCILCPEPDEVLAYSCGGRSTRTVMELLEKLKGVETEEYCTDHWKAFAQVLPAGKHRTGKAYIRNKEGVNT